MLSVAVVVAYAPAIYCGFISYDDPFYVTRNQHVLGGLTWENIQWAFTTLHAGLWIPLTWISLMVDTTVFGSAPWGYHLTNAALHLTSTLLLFAWLTSVTRQLGPSLLVAALHGLHPLHVESVAWVAERKDVLSTTLLLMMLWAYTSLFSTPSPRQRVATWFAFGMALLAKPALATVPVGLLFLDRWPLRRPDAGRQDSILEKVPFFITAGAVTAVTVVAQQRSGGVAPLSALSVYDRVATAATGYLWYLFKTVWPTHLAAFYPYDYEIAGWQTAGALAILGAISAGAYLARQRHPYLLAGWAWFVITLAPVSGIAQNGLQGRADRFVYVPHIGLFMAMVWGANALANRYRVADALRYGSSVLLVLVCVTATRAQVRWWENGVTLFERALAVTPDNPTARALLGLAFVEQGARDRAVEAFEHALRLDPTNAWARDGLHRLDGTESAQAGDYEEKALALVQAGDLPNAIAAFGQAVRLAPNDPKFRNDLANALAMNGRLAEAVVEYRRVLEARPGDAGTYMNMANALYMSRQPPEALAAYRRALQLDPNYAEAHFNLGVVLDELGQRSEAIEHWRTALRLKPNYTEAQERLSAPSALR